MRQTLALASFKYIVTSEKNLTVSNATWWSKRGYKK